MAHASLDYPSGLPPTLDVLLLLGLGVLVVCGARMPDAQRWFGGLLAAKQERAGRAVLLIAVLATLLHVASLAWTGVPKPWVTDEHAYLLGADTFSRGRLTNPLPILDAVADRQFEEAHVLTAPTRQSKYPPGQSLALALGQRLGAPWLVLPLLVFLLTASVGWSLLGAVPPASALLGTTLVGAWVGVGSYWSHSYWGGCLAAAAGALVFGAVARLLEGAAEGRPDRALELRWGFVCGLGLALLAMTRPYEGLVFSIPCGLAALWWIVRRASTHGALCWAAGTLLGLAPGLGFLLVYNRAVTGSARRLPHHVYTEQTPDVQPHFLWFGRSVAEFAGLFIEQLTLRASTATWFLIGAPLSLLLCLAPLLWLSRRRTQTSAAPPRPTVVLGFVCTAAVFVAQALVVPWFPHYPAALAAPLLLLGLAAVDQLRGVVFLGRTWERIVPTIALICALIGCVARLPAHRPDAFSDIDVRARALERLEAEPRRHIVFAPTGAPSDGTWTHNGAEPLEQRVLWARSADPQTDLDLARRLDRTPWRADLHVDRARVLPYR